jgi:hypothetical protein
MEAANKLQNAPPPAHNSWFGGGGSDNVVTRMKKMESQARPLKICCLLDDSEIMCLQK